MAELTKKLHFKKGATEHLAKAYSTTAEAGTEYITNKIDGVTAYVPIGATNDSRATMGRVKKSGGTEKAILTMGKPPYNKMEWYTPGDYTFTVPAGVNTIRITMSGGGGGGGAGLSGSSGTGIPGGGGGAGGYIKDYILNVEPSSTISVIVGAGATCHKGGHGDTEATSSKVSSIFADGGSTGNLFTGGKGGTSTTGSYGEDGNKGSHLRGGDGGMAGDGTPGGKGGEKGTYGQSGSRGSGGGGGGAGAIGGNGGDGYVIIEYGGDI